MSENKDIAVSRDARRTEAPRTRPENFGGPRLKLAVPVTIPGQHLYWENDDDSGAIEQLLYEGFSYVTKEEAGLGRGTRGAVVADDDITDRVSRFVGRKEDGTAMRAFLLKCSEEHWEARQRVRLAEADQRDESIRASVDGNGEGQYKVKSIRPSFENTTRKE